MDASTHRSRPGTGSRRLRAAAVAGLLTAVAATSAACANFSTVAQSYSAQPSLVPAEVTPVVPPPPLAGSGGTAPVPPSSRSTTGTAPPGSSAAADPCRPPDPVVVAACLSAPWGIAPLPDGTSALVGERTTGRILRVASGAAPVLVTTITGIDHAGDGGLLGLAVSPSYTEDGLIYAYVTTATDNRVLRIAAGDKPKPILTGIPKGRTHNGGALAFTPDSVLYVGTGDAGAAASAKSLAGKLLRIDEFGQPAEGDPSSTSPIFAAGLTQVTGLCALPSGTMAVLDHRTAIDVLLPARAGADYTTVRSGDAVWTWKAGDGGAADCAAADDTLANTSLSKQQLTGVAMSSTGAFSGSPRVLLGNKYGRLLSVEPGAKGALWLTTSNRDGHGTPVAADDRVLLLPDAGGAGGNGPD